MYIRIWNYTKEKHYNCNCLEHQLFFFVNIISQFFASSRGSGAFATQLETSIGIFKSTNLRRKIFYLCAKTIFLYSGAPRNVPTGRG